MSVELLGSIMVYGGTLGLLVLITAGILHDQLVQGRPIKRHEVKWIDPGWPVW